MNYSHEQLEEAEKFGALFFDESEVLIIVSTEDSKDIKQAILKGQLMAEAELREAIFAAAKNGSSPAQAEMLRLLKSLTIKKQMAKIT